MKPTEEDWRKGLDAGGRNVYPDPEEEEELEAEGVESKVVDGVTTGKEEK